MKLVTKQIRRILPSLSSQDGDGSDAMAYLKLFTPDSGFTWYITSGSQEGDDFMMFGLVDGLEKELGYVSLKELESVRGPMGLPIERDLYWTPKPLREIAPEMFIQAIKKAATEVNT